MSSLHNEQLVMAFKLDGLSRVSQTEVALLANWIEEILSTIDSEQENQVNYRMKS
jgi:hypothetical protein